MDKIEIDEIEEYNSGRMLRNMRSVFDPYEIGRLVAYVRRLEKIVDAGNKLHDMTAPYIKSSAYAPKPDANDFLNLLEARKNYLVALKEASDEGGENGEG